MASQGAAWFVLRSTILVGIALIPATSEASSDSLFLISRLAACTVAQVRAAVPISATSPDGRVRIEFSLQPIGERPDVPHYRVTFHDRDLVGPSRLGIEMEGGMHLGGACDIVSTESRSVHDEYTQFPGKRRAVTGDASELVVRLREKIEPRRTWEVVFRAYDDGAAFRYRFPKQEGWESLIIVQELTEFQLSADARTFALPLNGFTTSYENRYLNTTVGELPKDSLVGLPLLCGNQNGHWIAITEANVTEYAGMYLSSHGDGRLQTRLSPLPNEPKVAVRAPLPHVSPWRVVMLGDRIGRLVESDIVLNLSDPCEIQNTSWIKPGKTTFPWWNGFYEERVNFKPGLNTATAKYYIDFCSKAGIPYHSLDGVDNTAWYGGPIVPYEGAEPTKGVEGLDLAEVLRYAKANGVRIRLWMNWMAAQSHMEKAFPLFQEWGIEGVMLDFMDRDDQEMNRFLRSAVKLAADNRLTITLHGVAQPTGLERTYPNLLNHEAVLNLEYNKWDKLGCPPEHQVTVAFTRMLAGPLDFHQGSFRGITPEKFAPRDKAPFVMGTPCRTLSSYVVYQNHLPMVADSPSSYTGHPALPVLVNIPTAWDDTRVVAETVGEFVAIARRQGDTWHVGAMTDRKARTLKLPLKFLGPGRYAVELWVDDAKAEHGLSRRETTVTASDELTVDLAPSGGAYLKFTRTK